MTENEKSQHARESTTMSMVTVAGATPAAGAKKLIDVFVPHLSALWLGVLFLCLTNGFLLLLPRLINDGIDLIENQTVEESLLSFLGFEEYGIGTLVAAIVSAAILGAVARVCSRIVIFNIGRDVEYDLRGALFSHLSTLSTTYFQRHPTGDLMSRLTNDLTAVRLLAGFALLNAFNAALVFVVTLPLLFGLDVMVALAAITPFPLVMGLTQLLSKTMYRRTLKNQEELGRLTTFLQENLAGQSVVRAFQQQSGEEERFAEANQRAFEAAFSLSMLRVVLFPMMGLMSALGIGISIYAGGRAVIDGRMSIGDVVEFNARLLQLTWPAIAMGFIISVYQRGRASFDRLNKIFEARPDIVDGTHRADIEGGIEAKGLTVAYPGAESNALDGVSFRVEPGGTIGFVGRNASGKSTVVRALSRMLPVPSGQISIDGVAVENWHLNALNQQIALVPDDGFLFSITLRENLTFARPDATDEEVDFAIGVADLQRDIAGFPDGLETIVGERGVTLSGGQRQRVALARALLAQPRILVIDDGLSAVDSETESRIVAALRGGQFGGAGQSPPTLVIISHRLSAVREADEIIVLEEGTVLERGTHGDLLERDGRYADLWGREQLLNRLQEQEGVSRSDSKSASQEQSTVTSGGEGPDGQ
jgi:ATP-binding cassette, subfamily B, multidrug efflux pump